MLNKQIIPSLKDIYETVGKKSILYLENLHQFMINSHELSIRLKFGFGNNRRWCYKYCHKNKNICYVFFEKGAFTVIIQMDKNQLNKLYPISSGPKNIWKHQYVYGKVCWLNYRILNNKNLDDIKSIISAKINCIRKKVS